MTPFVVGIAGGSGSGKSTVVDSLVRGLGASRVALVEQDAYYRNRPGLTLEERAACNYDHPDAIDEELLAEHLRVLKSGVPVEAPIYDFIRHERRPETRCVAPRPCVVVEGILVLASPPVRRLLDLRLFVETDADVRFIRRLRRDVQERGRTVDSIMEQWETTVRPMHLQFVEPSKRHAHLILPEGAGEAALDVLLARLRSIVGAG
jgi:uridine kinase